MTKYNLLSRRIGAKIVSLFLALEELILKINKKSKCSTTSIASLSNLISTMALVSVFSTNYPNPKGPSLEAPPIPVD